MAARQRAGKALKVRRPRRHHAARRLSGNTTARQPRLRGLWWLNRDLRTPPPPLRGQHRLQGPPRAARPAFLRAFPRRRAARNRRIRRPPLVHRRPVPPRTEVAAARAAPAVRVLRAGGGGAIEAGVTTPVSSPFS